MFIKFFIRNEVLNLDPLLDFNPMGKKEKKVKKWEINLVS
jgi:hypothetical protein